MKRDEVYLRHILDAIERIESYVSRGPDVFRSETLVQDAVIRNLEVIGEAVKSLSPAVREREPEVPWSQVAGMRDVLIHQYFGVNLDTVWATIERRLPDLKQAVLRQLEVSER